MFSFIVLRRKGHIHLGWQFHFKKCPREKTGSGFITCRSHLHPHTVPIAEASHSDSLCTERRISENCAAADSKRGETGREQFVLANALPFSPAGLVV